MRTKLSVECAVGAINGELLRRTVGSNDGDRTSLASAGRSLSNNVSMSLIVLQLAYQLSNSCGGLQSDNIAVDGGDVGRTVLLQIAGGVQLVSYVDNDQVQSVVSVLNDPSVGYIVASYCRLVSFNVGQVDCLSALLAIDVDNSGVAVNLEGLRRTVGVSCQNGTQDVAARLLRSRLWLTALK